MVLENRLGIADPAELARQEERISKKRAVELYGNGLLERMEPGTFAALSEIHRYLLYHAREL